jgi:hypothetical protein
VFKREIEPNIFRRVLHRSLYATILGEGMRKDSKFRVAIVLFLMAILLGGSAAISITVTQILFVVAGIIVVGIVLFSIIGSRRNKKRK